ncbi:MAG: type II secretion system F family protein, partial [candidate division Zixibacteria bacterium]|nr:type II secretion system F family protein [candidate division Zixibacteria bacterium]
MPALYEYKAMAANGQPRKGTITVDNKNQVVDYLSEQQLIPISIKQVKKRSSLSLWGLFSGNEYENLIMFTTNLGTLYRAGIPLLRALSIIKVGNTNSRFNDALSRMSLSLQSGKSLSMAMTEFKDLFPGFYVANVAAGEESGKLDVILDNLSEILEKEMELIRQIKAGIRYPLMVIMAMVAAFVVMITYVVPKFVNFYSAFNAELPFFTRLLIGTSDFFSRYWVAILAFIVVLGFGFRKLYSDEKTRLMIDRTVLRIPIIGELIIKGNVARFSLLLSILLQSGLPLVRALDILTESVKNAMIVQEIREMRELFRKGKDSLLESTGFVVFPELALQMISIGLESGSLDKMLNEVGQHYSKQ